MNSVVVSAINCAYDSCYDKSFLKFCHCSTRNDEKLVSDTVCCTYILF